MEIHYILFFIVILFLQESELKGKSFDDPWSSLVETFNGIVNRVKINKGKSLDDYTFIESIQSNLLKDCKDGKLKDIDGPHTIKLVAGTDTKIYVLGHPRDQSEEEYFWILPSVECSPRVFEADSEESEEFHLNKMFSQKPWTTLMSRFHDIIQRADKSGGKVERGDISILNDLKSEIYIECVEGKMKQLSINPIPSVANVETRTYELIDQQYPNERYLWVLPDTDCPQETLYKAQDSKSKNYWEQPVKPKNSPIHKGIPKDHYAQTGSLGSFSQNPEVIEKSFEDPWTPLVETFNEIVTRVKTNKGKSLDDMIFIESIQSNVLKDCKNDKLKDIDGPNTISLVAGTDTKIYVLAHPRDYSEEQYFWILPSVDCTPRVYEPDSEESEELHFNKLYSLKPWTNLMSRFHDLIQRADKNGGKVQREDVKILNDLRSDIYVDCVEGKIRQLDLNPVPTVANVVTRTYEMTDQQHPTERYLWVLPDANCPDDTDSKSPNLKGNVYKGKPIRPRIGGIDQPVPNNNDPVPKPNQNDEPFGYQIEKEKPKHVNYKIPRRDSLGHDSTNIPRAKPKQTPPYVVVQNPKPADIAIGVPSPKSPLVEPKYGSHSSFDQNPSPPDRPELWTKPNPKEYGPVDSPRHPLGQNGQSHDYGKDEDQHRYPDTPTKANSHLSSDRGPKKSYPPDYFSTPHERGDEDSKLYSKRPMFTSDLPHDDVKKPKFDGLSAFSERPFDHRQDSKGDPDIKKEQDRPHIPAQKQSNPDDYEELHYREKEKPHKGLYSDPLPDYMSKPTPKPYGITESGSTRPRHISDKADGLGYDPPRKQNPHSPLRDKENLGKNWDHTGYPKPDLSPLTTLEPLHSRDFPKYSNSESNLDVSSDGSRIIDPKPNDEKWKLPKFHEIPKISEKPFHHDQNPETDTGTANSKTTTSQPQNLYDYKKGQDSPHVPGKKNPNLDSYEELHHREKEKPNKDLSLDPLPELSKPRPKPHGIPESGLSRPHYTSDKKGGSGYYHDPPRKANPYSSPHDEELHHREPQKPHSPLHDDPNLGKNWDHTGYPKPHISPSTTLEPLHSRDPPKYPNSQPNLDLSSDGSGIINPKPNLSNDEKWKRPQFHGIPTIPDKSFDYDRNSETDSGKGRSNNGHTTTPSQLTSSYDNNKGVDRPNIPGRKDSNVDNYEELHHREKEKPHKDFSQDPLSDYLSKPTPKPQGIIQSGLSRPQLTSDKASGLGNSYDPPRKANPYSSPHDEELLQREPKKPFHDFNQDLLSDYPFKPTRKPEGSAEVISSRPHNTNNKEDEIGHPYDSLRKPKLYSPFNEEKRLGNSWDNTDDGKPSFLPSTNLEPLHSKDRPKYPISKPNLDASLDEPHGSMKSPQTSPQKQHLDSGGFSGTDRSGDKKSKQRVTFDVDVEVSHTSKKRPKPDRHSRKQPEKGRKQPQVETNEDNVQKKHRRKPGLATDAQFDDYIEKMHKQFEEEAKE